VTLRKNLQDLLPSLPDFRSSDKELLRWLRARGLNLTEAEKMFRKSMKWRKDNNVDHILEVYTPPEVSF